MDKLYLRKLEQTDKAEVTEYLQELIVNGNTIKGFLYDDGKTFEQLYAEIKRKEKVVFNSYLQDDFPCVQYLVSEKESSRIVGFVSVRPFLTKELDKGFEGNIGYSVRPSERGKGYANIALKLAISEFKKINEKDDIVMCCYKENLPSKKVILNNGGVLIEEEGGILVAQKYLIKR